MPALQPLAALRNPRLRAWLAAWLGLGAIGSLLRAGLCASEGLLGREGTALGVMWRGAAVDLVVGVVLLTPVALGLALGRGRQLNRPRARGLGFTLLFALALFAAFVEYFFFQEFDARFNHIALDYLLFPGEVGGNIWESYPLPLYVALALGGGALLAWLALRAVRLAHFEARPWRSRFASAAGVLALSAAALAVLRACPASATGDRQVDELAGNGALQLARAFQSASLNYADFYRTVPEQELWTRAARELGWPSPASPARAFPAVERRAEPLDVVVILGESFGSEFVGRLGGARPCTPEFERWAEQGTLVTNLMATGNRTVRGLEGVLCSFVPLPGDSIWKRDKSDDVASLAGVLREQGYRTEFVYGGAGSFDGMRQFALQNGWQRFVEDGLVGASDFPSDAFRTAWGVADEHIFDALLQRQRVARAEGRRFCGTALTVSNHKPFLTPDTQDRSLRDGQLVASGAWGGALLLGTLLAWRFLRPRWSAVRLASLCALAWGGFGLRAWLEVQPRDSREAAVRYADRALGAYLDSARAEGLLEHTVVLFVGDHGARVYGAEEIPAASYRVPALFLAPEAHYHGRTLDGLCSQVDLVPTLLSIAGVDHVSPFFGQDLLAQPQDGSGGPGRAWLIHNRDVGLLTDDLLTVLGLRGTTTFYRRSGRASSTFTRVTGTAEDAELTRAAERAAAVFQVAATLYESRRYRLAHGG